MSATADASMRLDPVRRLGGTRQEHEAVLLQALLTRPDLVDGHDVRSDMFTDDLSHKLAVAAIHDKGISPPRLLGAKVAELHGLEPADVGRLLDRLDFNWPSAGLVSSWINDAIRFLNENARTIDLARAIERAQRQLRDPRTTASDIVPDLEKAIQDARSLNGPANSWPEPVDMAQLEGSADPEFVVDHYVALGFITLLVALWKAGKTTYIMHLLMGFLGRANQLGARPAKVLLVTEEHANHWVRRCRDHDLAGVMTLVRPFGGRRPDLRAWQGFIDHVAGLVERECFKLVVIDTFSNLGPLEDENDAAEMIAALTPINVLTTAGAAVLLVHHPRKGEGEQAQASRGSGAFPGFVDTILEMRRFRPNEPDNARRVLTAYSRFEDTPPETVIELREGRYVRLGSRQEVMQNARLKNLAEILPVGEDKAKSADEITSAWDEEIHGPMPGRLRDDLKKGFDDTLWHRTGRGVSGDPYKYFRREPGQ